MALSADTGLLGLLPHSPPGVRQVSPSLRTTWPLRVTLEATSPFPKHFLPSGQALRPVPVFPHPCPLLAWALPAPAAAHSASASMDALSVLPDSPPGTQVL